MKKEIKRPNFRYGYTHDKTFHADDVFSAALLQLLCPDITIVRKRNIDKGTMSRRDTIVFDMGGGEFDHHQSKKQERQDGTPYASFGLLWKKYGICLVDSEDSVAQIDSNLVRWIDDTDNGGSPNTLTSAIKVFNPCWDEENQKTISDDQFFLAVQVARTILENYIKRKRADYKADRIIEQACKVQRGGVIVLEKFLPIGTKIDKGIMYAIYPNSSNTEYVLEAVLDSNRKPRRAFTKEAIKSSIGKAVHNNTLHYKTLEEAIDIANCIINASSNTNISEIIEDILSSDCSVYDPKTESNIPVFGFVKMKSMPGIYCPILSDHGMYSLTPLALFDNRNDKLKLTEDYYGMVMAGKERDDDRFSYIWFNNGDSMDKRQIKI